MMTRHFLFSWFLFLLAGAVAAQERSETKITYVHGYKGMAEYARAIASSGRVDRETLYRKHVYDQYFSACSGDAPRRAMSRQFLSMPVEDAGALIDVIEELEQSKFLDKIAKAATDSTELLPIDKLTICIFVVPPDSDSARLIIDMFRGVYGFSEAPGVLWLHLLPTEGWLDEIFPGFSHEYFHAAAHPDNPMGTNEITLLDLLVNEGGADSFTNLLYPDFVPGWTKAISLQQEIELWPVVREKLDSTDSNLIQNILFGDGDHIPNQAGYTIGYQIVQGYLAANPDQPPIVWSRIDPKEVLAQSGYAKRVEEKGWDRKTLAD